MGRGSIRNVVLAVVIFVVLLTSLFFWFLLHSPIVANLSFVMTARARYYIATLPKIHNFFDKKNPFYNPNNLPFSVFAFAPGYGYAAIGRFENIDIEGRILYFKDKNKQVYGFKFDTQKLPSGQEEMKFQEVDKSLKMKVKTLIIEIDPQKTLIPFKKGDVIRVYWDDKRKLEQVLRDAKLGSGGILNINNNEVEGEIITRFVSNN